MGLLPDQPMGSAEYDRDFVRGTGGPRASRDNAPPPAPTIDYGRLPTQGPFVCFIGNLPYEVDESDIRSCFPGVSITNVKIPKDETQRPRGFAYIELADQDSLIKALLSSGAVPFEMFTCIHHSFSNSKGATFALISQKAVSRIAPLPQTGAAVLSTKSVSALAVPALIDPLPVALSASLTAP